MEQAANLSTDQLSDLVEDQSSDLADYILRPYSVEDLAFIRSSWANSYYDGNKDHKLIPPQDFHNSHRALIDRFFQRPTSTVIIACNPNDINHILGWIAIEILPSAAVVHYVYVKQAFKGEKLASKLLSNVPTNKPIVITHMTERASRILAKKYLKYKDFKYMPHLA